MTARGKARWAVLFVGSTDSTSKNVHKAGSSFKICKAGACGFGQGRLLCARMTKARGFTQQMMNALT
jgi:hypothetical protein